MFDEPAAYAYMAVRRIRRGCAWLSGRVVAPHSHTHSSGLRKPPTDALGFRFPGEN
jgi:hypothetical protein